MNPDAVRYYRKWLSRRFRPVSFYLALLLLALLYFAGLAAFFRVRLGDWSMNGTLAILAPMTLAAGSLLIGAVRLGASIGAWTLLESLEAGHKAGHSRDVWRALMVKYRGLIPAIVAHDRFHRLFVSVGSDIVAHEDLTVEQARWMDELLSLADENLTAGRVAVSTSKASYAKPLFIGSAIFATLSALIKVLGSTK